jgi:hypothetical protein
MDDREKDGLEKRVEELERRLRSLTRAMWVVGCCPRCGSKDVRRMEEYESSVAWECLTCYVRSIDDD